MDQEQVELIDAEVRERLLEGALDVVGGVVGVSQLAGDEELLARDAGGRDRPADAEFGAVGLGGVDMAVAGLQRLADDRFGDLGVGVVGLAVGLQGEGPVAELRDRRAGVERDFGDGLLVVGINGS